MPRSISAVTAICLILIAIAPSAAAQGCFGNDAGMASVRIADHLRWARSQSPAAIEQNLTSKIEQLSACPSVSDAAFADTFAEMSVLIGSSVQWSDSCLAQDPGARSEDPAVHRAFARGRSRRQLSQNLQNKAVQALRCVDKVSSQALFAGLSVTASKTAAGLSPAPGRPARPPVSVAPAPPQPPPPPGNFFVVVRTSPCSGSPNDWISVTNRFPVEGGLGTFQTVDMIEGSAPCVPGRGGCSFAAAQAEAARHRTSPRFADFACPAGFPSGAPSTTADNGFRVWARVSGCSGTRTDWVSVAKENPSGFQLADFVLSPLTCSLSAPGGCTFAAATAEAAAVRASPRFSNFCCREYSVIQNGRTGEMFVHKGMSYPFGFDVVRGNLCCEEAESLAGKPGGCRNAQGASGPVTSTRPPAPGPVPRTNGNPVPQPPPPQLPPPVAATPAPAPAPERPRPGTLAGTVTVTPNKRYDHGAGSYTQVTFGETFSDWERVNAADKLRVRIRFDYAGVPTSLEPGREYTIRTTLTTEESLPGYACSNAVGARPIVTGDVRIGPAESAICAKRSTSLTFIVKPDASSVKIELAGAPAGGNAVWTYRR